MSGFIRRFTQDPGISELTAIEGTVIIEREPMGNIRGAATGVAIAVGEFEDGDYIPFEVSSSTDLFNNYGSFGFTYDGVPSQNPCARSRRADNALKPEYWNGNGFISLVNKKFSRLIVTRVDTSVGEVQFTRNASVLGAIAFNYALVSGATIGFSTSVDGVYSPASITSAAGTYPTTFGGTETITIILNSGAITRTVTFADSDETRAAVISRINLAFPEPVAFEGTAANTIVLRTPSHDPTGSVQVSAVSGVLVTTATGFSAGSVVNNTNNTVNATFTGVAAAVTSAAGTYPTTFVGGESMSVVIDEGLPTQIGPVTVTYLSTDTAIGDVVARINATLGYTAASIPSGTSIRIVGRTQGTSGSVRIISVSSALVSTATGFTPIVVNGTGNVANIAQVTFNEVKTVVEAAVAGVRIELTPGGALRAARNSTTAGARISVGNVNASALGFTLYDSDTLENGSAGVIPAGFRVTDGSTTWVTTQTTNIDAGVPGPYRIRIRPANDDGSSLGAIVSTVTKLVSALTFDSFVVTNNSVIGPALTEAAIDAAYVNALEKTLNTNSIARKGTLIFCARSSNAVRSSLRQNALRAASEGLAGRVAVVRPPLGTTTRAQAKSRTAQPGVGAYRDQHLVYAFPGCATSVPQIATRGLSGGVGFTADGIIDVGFDSWVVSLMSQLPPEENPGQLTGFMAGIVSIERGNPDVQDMKEPDYVGFKESGIAALRIDDGVAIIQSGVTSVDPQVQSSLVNIARRRMADFVQDSIAPRLKNFNKRLNTRDRRATIVGELEAFMNGLVSPNNPKSQRIDSYFIDAISGNTPESLAAGIFRIILKVRTLSSLDTIVLDSEIGENVVTIKEAA